ncbi:hypothetical protein RPO42_08515, partial [Staphylococcus aureus]|nr:hypothetical protein [Staphylococcus aureus]
DGASVARVGQITFDISKDIVDDYIQVHEGAVCSTILDMYSKQAVWELIKPRLVPSLEMGLTAMVIGVIIGLILGVIAAVRQNTWVDYTATVISVIAVSV